MLWGGVATIAGLLWLPLGRALGWVAWLFVAYTVEMVEVTATMPYASVILGRVSAGLVWAYYGLLLAGVRIMHQDQDKRRAWWERLTRHLPAKVLVSGLVIVLILVWVAACYINIKCTLFPCSLDESRGWGYNKFVCLCLALWSASDRVPQGHRQM
jgi:xanthine/uracil permease